ncbi:hypothetical protein MRX96_027457 [Rhipicephalus microplus]
MVRTLKQVLRKMLNNKDKWQKELPRATLAINATKHHHSGQSPFRLMHGYDPKLPGELNLASVEGDIDESHRLHDLARGACGGKREATAESAQNNGPIRQEAANSEVHNGGTSSCLS